MVLRFAQEVPRMTVEEGLTPDEQMKMLCDMNGPITMLVALEQVFRDMVDTAKPGDFVAYRSLKINVKIADGLADLIRSIAGG